MLELRDYGYNYRVVFNGEKKDFSDFFVTMVNLKAQKLVNQKGWKIPKCYLPDLATFFDVVHVLNPWDTIGEGLKLEPYCYQKEAIKYAVDNGKALLILPCGSGKI